MALVNMSNMLIAATKERYAVGAFNVVDLSFLEAILTTAERLRSPVILNIAEVHFRYVDIEAVAPVVIRAAQNANIPVAFNLDHGVSFEAIIKAIRAGFSSVMFDGSKLPFEQNIKNTAEVVRIAHSVGVSVEAELGHVTGGEGSREGSMADPSLFTRPDEAVEFVKQTGVDALAISFGSAHGIYKGMPKLDFELLQQIRSKVEIPLVLHGGSGIPEEDFRTAIKLGISKINIYTEMTLSAVQSIRKVFATDPGVISYPDIVLEVKKAVQTVVEDKMTVFGSLNVCSADNLLCKTCSIRDSDMENKKKLDKKELNNDNIISDIVSKVLAELGYK